jgi:predicted small secreted protein
VLLKREGDVMRRLIPAISLIVLAGFLAGCGETVHGMVKDTRRIGSGVKKVFIRE